ncbi:MAG: hypothetical protein U1E62_21540 [Alsobacter sp.]
MSETINEDGEIIAQATSLPALAQAGSSLAVQMLAAEIDNQITTARAYPRQLAKVANDINALITLDRDSATECVYALPRGGKPIEGPSIRMAEIIASQWGNCRVGARVTHVDRKEMYVEAEGIFHDLESNAVTTSRVRRRISDKRGRLLSDDMIIVTGNAACSIAKRNAIITGVPKAVWRQGYGTAIQVIKGDIKTLAERRARAIAAFGAFGVTAEQIFLALAVQGIEDITLDHMPTLLGMHAAIKSGEETVETLFNPRNNGKAFERGKNFASDEKPVGEGQGEQQAQQGQSAASVGEQNAIPDQGSAEGETPASEAAKAGPAPNTEGLDPVLVEAAERHGWDAAKNGRPRRVVPVKFQEPAALRAVWERAFDAAKEDQENRQ